MDDPAGVRVLERGEGLVEHRGRLGRRERAARVEDLAHGTAVHVLHDHVVDAVDGAPVEDGDDVRVVQGRRGARLAAEAVDEPRVGGERPVEDLDRDLAVEHGVVAEVDLAHAPRGDPLGDPITAVKGHQRLARSVAPGALCHALGHRPPVGGSARTREGARRADSRPREAPNRGGTATTPAQEALRQIERELARIEGAVGAGNTDLAALGFWRVVAAIKRDEVAIIAFADLAGRIDRNAFRARVRTRVRPWIGVVAMVLLSLLGVAGVWLAAVWDGFWAGAALVGAGLAWSIGWHLPADAFFGWLAGIRFTDAFLGGPPPPRPGIKTDYATYLRAEPTLRAWFHASGAIATKIAPFLALALWPATNAPVWAAAVLLAIGIVQIVTDVTLSTRSSDWKKFRRERRVIRDRQAALSRF